MEQALAPTGCVRCVVHGKRNTFLIYVVSFPTPRGVPVILAKETVSQFVIPAKTREAGREPESRNL